MRTWPSAFAAALLAASCAYAFDVDAWHAKRALHLQEAERLRVAYTNCVARLQQTADNVTLPVETNPDGSVRFVVQARRAQFFLDEGLVWAENVVAKRFDEAGGLDTRIDARACVVDRHSKSGWAEGAVRVRHGKTTLTGRNAYFSSAESFVRISEAADIQSEDVEAGAAVADMPGRASGDPSVAPRTARIRSATSDYDREEGVILFDGDVRIEYAGDYTMNADQLYAFLAGTNALSRVVAVGGVTITNGTRVGTCSAATYRRVRREIEMHGDGKDRPAHLADHGGDATELDGARIRFWLDSEQVEVEDSRIKTKLDGRGPRT